MRSCSLCNFHRSPVQLLRIREIVGSNFGPKIGEFLGLSWFASVHPNKCRYSLSKWVTITSFHILPSSSIFVLSLGTVGLKSVQLKHR